MKILVREKRFLILLPFDSEKFLEITFRQEKCFLKNCQADELIARSGGQQFGENFSQKFFICYFHRFHWESEQTLANLNFPSFMKVKLEQLKINRTFHIKYIWFMIQNCFKNEIFHVFVSSDFFFDYKFTKFQFILKISVSTHIPIQLS